MLLLIDVGNTRIKWALADTKISGTPGTWSQSGSMTHAEFAQQSAPWHDYRIGRVVVSNVAGSAIRDQLCAMLEPEIRIEWFSSQLSLAGITNHYQQPEKLGSDRFATAIAAHALYPDRDLVVVTCGTATTIDAVSAQGDFIGGMIAPGLLLMAQSLAQKTAQLPQVQDLSITTAQFADHTEAAIVAGCLAAQAGAIEYAVRNFSGLARADSAPFPLCILSGGAACYIAPCITLPYERIDHLVLIGLQVFAAC